MARPVKRKLRVDRIIIALVIVVFLIKLVLKLPIFNIGKITVDGNKQVTDEMIIEASEKQIGDSIIYLSKNTVKSNILRIPWIRDVKLNRKPLRTLKITVEEREPVAYTQIGNDYIIVDSNGVIFEKRNNTSPSMTYIKGLKNSKDIKLGNTIYSCGTEDQNLLLEEIFKGDDYKKFKSINLEEEKTNMVLKNDVDVSFGSYNNIEYKLAVLDVMYQKIIETDEDATMILMEDGPNPILVKSTD